MDRIEKYIEAEIKLINLMGYANPVLGKLTKKMHAQTTNEAGKTVNKEFPQWARDDGASFKLITEYNLSISCNDQVAIAKHDNNVQDGASTYTTHVADFPDKEAALRFAVISCVITMLEQGKHK